MSQNKKSSEQSRRSHRITGKSLTQQHPAKEADINTIVKRYLPTGALPSHGRQPIYGDFTSIDYMTMQNQIADIDTAFMRLPARLRGRFKNDPYQLMRFIDDPKNRPEAIRLGLLVDPSAQFGFDKETGLAQDTPEKEPAQLDAMSQAEVLDALNPDHESYDPELAPQLRARAQEGDQESRLLLEMATASAKKKAQNPPKRPVAAKKGGS